MILKGQFLVNSYQLSDTNTESFHGGNGGVFSCDNHVVNHRNIAFMLQYNLPGMHAWMYLLANAVTCQMM